MLDPTMPTVVKSQQYMTLGHGSPELRAQRTTCGITVQHKASWSGYRNQGCAAWPCPHRDVKDRLAPACQREVFKVQMDAAADYRADAAL